MTGRVVFAALLLAASAWAQPGAHSSSQADKQQSYTKDKDGDHRWINLKLQAGTPTPAPAAGRCMIGCFGATPGIQASIDGGPYEPIGTGGGGGCDCPTPTPGINSLNGSIETDQLMTVTDVPPTPCESAHDFCIDSTTTPGTHVFSLPDASVNDRGVVTTGSQFIGGQKTFADEATFQEGFLAQGPVTLENRSIDTPSILTILSDGDTILTDATFVVLVPDADYTFTTTPTLEAGVANGQHVTLGVDSTAGGCLTFTDEADLTGSGLQLSDHEPLTLCAGQFATFRWDSTTSLWLEQTGRSPLTLQALGATMTASVCIAEDVQTAIAHTVQTVASIPAGTTVDNCLVKTVATITGPYSAGLPGAPDGWGRIGGTIGNTNRTSTTAAGPIRMATSEPVVFTSRQEVDLSGNFQETTGTIRVVCFCHTFGGF